MSLGSIVVMLTMNTADFETDAGRASKVAERRAKEIDSAFKKAGVAIGLALSAGVAIATRALTSAIDKMDETSKAAQKVGLPTEEFSRLAYAGDLADVSMDTMVSTLGKLTKAQAAAIDKTSEQARVFSALGIDVIDPLTGSMRESSEVLEDFADRFQKMEGSPEAMAAGFVLFGRSFQDMIPLLKDGAAGIRAAGDEADALGKTISTSAGIAAEHFNDNLTRLKGALQGVVFEVAGDVLPVLIDMTDGLVDSAKEGSELNGILTSLASVADGVGAAFSGAASLTSAFGNALDALGLRAEDSKTGLADLARTIGDVGRLLGSFGNRIGGGIDQLTGILTGDPSLEAKGVARQRDALRAGRRALYGQPDFSNVRSGPDFSNVQGGSATPGVDSGADAARLRAALGGTPKKDGAAKKKELTDEQKAAEQLKKAYEGLTGSMAERIALFGEETELAKLNYEIQSGSLKGLGEAEQAKLRQQAIELDNLELQEEGRRILESSLEPFERINAERDRAKELLEAGALAQDEYNRAIRDLRTPAEEMLADMQFELELLGKTREEQELLTAARYLGAEAATEQGKAALAALEHQQEAAKQIGEQIEAMDGLRDAARGFFDDLKAGESVWDSLKNALGDFADKLWEMATNNLIERALGQQGSTGTGSGGGWLGALFGAFFGGSGGGTSASAAGWDDLLQGNWGFSSGGFTGYGGVRQPAGVVHKGEVVWSQGDVARSGGVAAVESMRRSGGGGGNSRTVINNFSMSKRNDNRSERQVAKATGMAIRMAT